MNDDCTKLRVIVLAICFQKRTVFRLIGRSKVVVLVRRAKLPQRWPNEVIILCVFGNLRLTLAN